jgi:hypothetical protein
VFESRRPHINRIERLGVRALATSQRTCQMVRREESLVGNSRLTDHHLRNFRRETDGTVSPNGVRDRHDVLEVDLRSGGWCMVVQGT